VQAVTSPFKAQRENEALANRWEMALKAMSGWKQDWAGLWSVLRARPNARGKKRHKQHG
jgi:hypothetical protein